MALLRCGSTDVSARREPLLVVTGASAAGKISVYPELARELRGECIIFDADWLIDPLGGDVTTLDWVALRDLWLHVAHGVAQNGLPTLLLGGFVPQALERSPAAAGSTTSTSCCWTARTPSAGDASRPAPPHEPTTSSGKLRSEDR